MASKAHKLGPGTLTFGAEGSESEWGASVTAVTIEPDVDEGDEMHFLDGTSDNDEDVTWKLSGTVAQNFNRSSLQIWAKEQTGKPLAFTFRPRNDAALTIKGTCRIRPVSIGGDVRSKNTSDFEFPVVGDWDHEFDTNVVDELA
ncbi:MAG: hypothetical protein Q4G34_00200 [Micrococcus sp.]|nr:hypothetical protein [Micrococcus sp.]